MNQAFLVTTDNKLICRLDSDLKSGTTVTYAYNLTADNTLVNSREGKISLAQKYQKSKDMEALLTYAEEVRDRYFYLTTEEPEQRGW